ncbi:NAD-dependent epimerase/dehydratase family protein [Nocardioides pantholopis]|uniref:NAD-dependent epimerase/dehydratase family protein n=1 Tax=Nocardioides pantholopis TaxID=2483798 RepID=UPI000FDA4BBC|nr:NAD-dependent epimerase/dehydratase family protein [Nocardioides pantholopis]
MRIAITGATGNIGTALVRRLVSEHDLVGLVRRPPDGSAAGVESNVEWHPVDLTTEQAVGRLRTAFEGVDAVVHLAWGFQPTHAQNYLAELDLGGTRRVLEAVRSTGVPHLVHMSSLGAYSPKEDDTPVTEDWPTDGVRSSTYSRHKADAETMLDDFEATGTTTTVTRVRPGIVGQRSAGSALLRYALPALVPARVLGHVPVLPVDRHLVIPIVHADDVAEAIARMLERRAGGAFNLAADPPMTAARIADVLGARLVHVPAKLLRGVVAGSWYARLQPIDAGWLDMGMAVPLLDTTRARTVLDWAPTRTAEETLAEVLAGMRDAASGTTPILRPRSVPGALVDAVRRGAVSVRQRP